MVPRLNKRGSSFKGVSAYLFHDKGADTADRLTWAETRNIWTEDPADAWREMAATWADRHALKKAAGVDSRGRDNTTPVLHYSLAWHPDQKPDRAEMKRAAEASLEALGLTAHQAIILAHDDTKHSHVHVVVNTIDPMTGRSAPLKYTKERLSRWAEAYERDHGHILCHQRVENNRLRQEFAAARDADPDAAFWPVKDRSPLRHEWLLAADTAAKIEASPEPRRETGDDRELWDRQRADRRVLKDQSILLNDRARAHVRDEYKPAWRALYAAQREELALIGLGGSKGAGIAVTDPAEVIEALTKQDSTFTRQDLARYLNVHTADAESFAAMKAAVESSPQLVSLGKDAEGRERLTSRDMLATERRMAGYAEALAGRSRHQVNMIGTPSKVALGDDQRAALAHITGGRDLAAVVGFAGTGKSTMLAAARAAWEAAGYTVHGATLSGIAAEGLEAGSGIHSRTLASLEYAWKNERDQLGSKAVLVIDEAGLIGSRQMERILATAARAGAKVVLVGDQEQLQAIDAGGAFRAIVERVGAAEIATVRRQREDWQKRATADLATGRTAEAIGAYEQAGMVHRHALRDDAKAALIDVWHRDRQADPAASSIILAHSRADVKDLNERARAKLRESGQLGEDQALDTERGRRKFAAGDRIMFLQNNKAMGVKNGTLGVLERIDGRGLTVCLDGDRAVTFALEEYRHFDHGYAATIHKSQGVTVDRAHVLASARMDRHAAYVALSRHRDSVALHWAAEDMGDRNGMARALSRRRTKDTSLDYGSATASNGLVTAEERAAYIEANRKRFAIGGAALTANDIERLAGSPSALAAHVAKVHDQERRALASGQKQRRKDLALAVQKRHVNRYSDLFMRQAMERDHARQRNQETGRAAAQKAAEDPARGSSARSVDEIRKRQDAYYAKLKAEGKKPGFGRKFEP